MFMMVTLLWVLGCSPSAESDTSPSPTRDDSGSTPSSTLETGDSGVSTDPTDTPTDEPTVPAVEDPGAALFADPLGEMRIDFTFADHAAESLRASSDSWVPATIAVDGFGEWQTGVRLKGNGSFRPFDSKPSFKVQLDRYVDGQAIDGLDEFVLNNMWSDPSGMREHLAYEVYRAMGVPAPRSRYAKVYVDGDYRGLYVLVEEVDGRFLNRWFEDGDGPLYEMFDVELTPAGVWQLDHDGGPDDRSALMALAEVIADPDTVLTQDAAELLDLDSFVAYFGASAAIAQYDAYPYSFPGDDVYFYVDPSSGRIHLLPHGGDETFRDRERPADYVFGQLAIRCLQDPVCEARFDQAVWDTLDGMEAMGLESYVATVADAVVPGSLQGATQVRSLIDHDRAIIESFVAGRRGDVEAMVGIE